MDLLNNLAIGLQAAFTFKTLAYCFLGTLLGTLIGVLPGIGPIATIALLLPVTYALEPVTALIMLAGIYYGAQYGGSTTAILVNLPGESSSVVTMIDGYQMARRGRAGPALTAAAVSSFIAGCLATIVIAGFAPLLADVALNFGPWEYFALMVVGLIGAVVLAHGSVLKAMCMIVLGLLLGLAGTDVNSGVARFTLGYSQLADGIGFIIIAMGIIAMAEIIGNLQRPEHRDVYTDRVPSLLPTREEWRRMLPASLRGTALGSILGILPGGGTSLAAFSAYSLEKKIADAPERFGKGAIEGVASPEAANNAASQTSFIPMLTLGIPSNAVMALMIGAMTIHSIQPGPEVMTKNPELFWGLIVSMWVGNVMLVVLNLPLVGLWIKLLKVPYRFMFPAIMMFSAIGIYSVNGATFDIVLTAAFGLLGFVLMKLGCEPAPLLLGFILGPMMEENLRRAMSLARGDASSFFARPISASLLPLAATLLVVVALPALKRKREEIFQE